jgi:hypothetical protein
MRRNAYVDIISHPLAVQIYNELKEAEDGLKDEKKKSEELEQRVTDETQKAAEATKQLEEQSKLNEEEIRTLKEECEKNKRTSDAGELFKISQEVMKLRGTSDALAFAQVRVISPRPVYRETELSRERGRGTGKQVGACQDRGRS